MEEKRRFKRLPISMKLEISSLFKQDHIELTDLSAPIHVSNVSKGGIGFTSVKNRFPLETRYGCEMVGLAPVLDYIFDDYEKNSEA